MTGLFNSFLGRKKTHFSFNTHNSIAPRNWVCFLSFFLLFIIQKLKNFPTHVSTLKKKKKKKEGNFCKVQSFHTFFHSDHQQHHYSHFKTVTFVTFWKKKSEIQAAKIKIEKVKTDHCPDFQWTLYHSPCCATLYYFKYIIIFIIIINLLIEVLLYLWNDFIHQFIIVGWRDSWCWRRQ